MEKFTGQSKDPIKEGFADIINSFSRQKTNLAERDFDDSDKYNYLKTIEDRRESDFKQCFRLLICICVYNESFEDLDRTLEGIRLNLINFSRNGIF